MTASRWLTLAVVSAATAMLLLDVTLVNVALPAIQADLDASFGELQWVVDAYALTLPASHRVRFRRSWSRSSWAASWLSVSSGRCIPT